MMGFMAAEATGDDLQERANRALAELAASQGGGSYAWVVVHEGGEKMGGCSNSLRPYQDAFENEVSMAIPMEISPTGNALPKTEATFAQKTRTKHTDLHPIVAVLMAKLNEINGHNSPRTMALTHPDTLPPWFPHHPRVYAERAQAMSLPQLFQVLDSIFSHVRRHVAAIHSLHAALAAHFRGSSVPTRTRACFEAFFDFLKREAEETGGKPREGRGTPRRAKSPSVGTLPRARIAGVSGPAEATGATLRGSGRRRGLRNSPNAESNPAGRLFLPSPGTHPSEMVGDLDEDVPILDNPRASINRGRRARNGDQAAGGAGMASPKTEPESPWAEEHGLRERGHNRSTKRRREGLRLPTNNLGEAGIAGKKSRMKTEANDAFTGRAVSDLSAHSSTPRVDVPLAWTGCAESTPEPDTNGVEHSGGAGTEELGGKGWDDEGSEQSFDEYLTDVNWELALD